LLERDRFRHDSVRPPKYCAAGRSGPAPRYRVAQRVGGQGKVGAGARASGRRAASVKNSAATGRPAGWGWRRGETRWDRAQAPSLLAAWGWLGGRAISTSKGNQPGGRAARSRGILPGSCERRGPGGESTWGRRFRLRRSTATHAGRAGGQFTPWVWTSVAGSMPRLRTASSQRRSLLPSKTRRADAGATSQAPCASSRSSCPGPQPA